MNELTLKYNANHAADRYYVKERKKSEIGKTIAYGMWVSEDVLTQEQIQRVCAAWMVTSIYDSGIEFVWPCIVKTEHTERKSYDLTLRLSIR